MDNIIKRTWKQGKMVRIDDLQGFTFQAEEKAHTFQIEGIDEDGQQTALSGTISAVFLRPDNTDVAITGSMSDGMAMVTLTAECYAVPGKFGLTVYLTSGENKIAIYAAVGYVCKTSSGTASSGTTADVVDLINRINTAIAACPATHSDIMASIAPTYSSSSLYAVGSYCWYDGKLRKCISPVTTAGDWATNSSKFALANMGGDVSDLKSAINNFYGFPNRIALTNGTNLNNVTTYGVYSFNTGVAVTLSNCPISTGGILIVERTSSSDGLCRQRIYQGTTGYEFVRRKDSNGNWNEWQNVETDIKELQSKTNADNEYIKNNQSSILQIANGNQKINLNDDLIWQSGRFTISTGSVPTELTQSNRIKTDYLQIKNYVGVANLFCDSGYKFSYVLCNDDKEVLSSDTNITSKTITISSNVSYIRFILGYSDDADITTDKGSHFVFDIKNRSIVNNCLIICGADATDFQKDRADYVCDSVNSIYENDINTIIDQYINDKITIFFYGTIRTAHGIHKHPKHNMNGYDCTLMMGDNLGQDYVCCIQPTTGGIEFETSQTVSHSYTYVKGFKFDGRCEFNKSNDQYSYKAIYGCVIAGSIFNDENPPYTRTQLCTHILLEDIDARETMRGIAPGFFWICNNITVRNATTDHAIYIPGSAGVIMNNVRITGKHKNHALCISDGSWDVNTQTRNTRITNIFFDECQAGILDIRGYSITAEGKGDLPNDDVHIENMFVKNLTNPLSPSAIWIGSYSNNTEADPTKIRDFPTNIRIDNLIIDAKMNGTPISIYNANVIMQKASIRVRTYASEGSIFRLQGVDVLRKAVDLSGTRIDFLSTTENTINIFIFDRSTSGFLTVNGFDIHDLVINRNSNYYLFAVTPTSGVSESNIVTIKDMNADRVLSNPVSIIKPDSEDYIVFDATAYTTIEF